MLKNVLLHRYCLTLCLILIAFFALPAQPPTIICPGNTITVGDSSTNDPLYWNNSLFFDSKTSNHDLAENNTPLVFSATDHCSESGDLSFKYVLYLDLNRDSTIETVIDSDSLPAHNRIYLGNSATQLFSGTVTSFDGRVVTTDKKWGFGISVTPEGDGRKAQVIWKDSLGNITAPEIPYGYHRIKWTVTDSCGDVSQCEYHFTVKDNKKPDVVCLNNISVNLFNVNGTGLLNIWASDMLQYTEDNYTPNNLLTIAIRRSGQGIGFPYNPNGTPQVGLSFTCEDLGVQPIELWSIDKDGNSRSCQTNILIQNGFNVECSPGNVLSTGYIKTEYNVGIADVQVELIGNGNGLPNIALGAITDTSGNYYYNNPLPIAGTARISPILELDPLNGVNTYDLVLISRHILGLEPLGSAYKIIAADVNKSGTLTTYDIVEIRRLILGSYTEYPNNNSWRFVDKSQVFSNPLNPLADTLRESIAYNVLSLGNTADFIGCKIGDVDNTAIPHFQGAPEERNESSLQLWVNDRSVSPGDRFTVHFDAPEKAAGFQMTLSARGLQVTRVIPGQGIGQDHFNLTGQSDRFNAVPVLTTAIETGSAAFDVECTALSSGQLSEMLQITHEITRSMAFSNSGERFGLQLNFSNKLTEPALFQNNPNPWSDRTTFQFYLPEAATATVSILDIHGRVITSQTGYWPAGLHPFELRQEEVAQSGVYYCRLATGTFSMVQKSLFIR